MGKSFNELGTTINNVFKTYLDDIDNFDKNISFWDALKENLFSKDDNWIKNSLGEIISKDNIDSYIEEIDLDSAKKKAKSIFDYSEDVKKWKHLGMNFSMSVKTTMNISLMLLKTLRIYLNSQVKI